MFVSPRQHPSGTDLPFLRVAVTAAPRGGHRLVVPQRRLSDRMDHLTRIRRPGRRPSNCSDSARRSDEAPVRTGQRGRDRRVAGADWPALMRRTRVGASGRRGRGDEAPASGCRGRCRRGACERSSWKVRRGACERLRGRCRRGACERPRGRCDEAPASGRVEGADEAPASGRVEGAARRLRAAAWKVQTRRLRAAVADARRRCPSGRRGRGRRGGGSAGHPRGGGREGSSFGGRTGLLAVCGDAKAGPRPQRRPPAPCRPPPRPLLPPRRPAHGAVSGRCRTPKEDPSLPPSPPP